MKTLLSLASSRFNTHLIWHGRSSTKNASQARPIWTIICLKTSMRAIITLSFGRG